MSHYFIDDKTLKDKPKMIRYYQDGLELNLQSNEGVFSKHRVDYGTETLLESMVVLPEHTRILDMGCGYGIIGLYLAKKWPDKQILMADINEKAVALSKENARDNRIKNVTIIQSNLFEHIDGSMDIIVSNPPIRAGKKVVFELYEKAYEHLNQQGHLYVVIQKKQGAPSTVEKLESLFSEVRIVNKNRGYWIILAIK